MEAKTLDSCHSKSMDLPLLYWGVPCYIIIVPKWNSSLNLRGMLNINKTSWKYTAVPREKWMYRRQKCPHSLPDLEMVVGWLQAIASLSDGRRVGVQVAIFDPVFLPLGVRNPLYLLLLLLLQWGTSLLLLFSCLWLLLLKCKRDFWNYYGLIRGLEPT